MAGISAASGGNAIATGKARPWGDCCHAKPKSRRAEVFFDSSSGVESGQVAFRTEAITDPLPSFRAVESIPLEVSRTRRPWRPLLGDGHRGVRPSRLPPFPRRQWGYPSWCEPVRDGQVPTPRLFFPDARQRYSPRHHALAQFVTDAMPQVVQVAVGLIVFGKLPKWHPIRHIGVGYTPRRPDSQPTDLRLQLPEPLQQSLGTKAPAFKVGLYSLPPTLAFRHGQGTS